MLTVISTRFPFENKWLRLREDRVRYPDGAEGVYAFIERPRFAIVAAIEDGHVWMVEQWRHPMGARNWELPMGVAPGGDDAPIEDGARLELREETGVEAAHWTRIGEIVPSPALVAQTGVLFHATGLTHGPQALEDTEQDLVARPWPIAEALAAIAGGGIRDAVTLASFGLLRLRGLL